MYDSYLFKSSKQCFIISLSDSIPSARIRIKSGTGLRTLGTLTTICLFVNFEDGLTIRTESVRTGLDASSDTERISAE